MTRKELLALALNAREVGDAIATLKWMWRGVVLASGAPSQLREAERSLELLERAERSAKAVAAQLATLPNEIEPKDSDGKVDAR